MNPHRIHHGATKKWILYHKHLWINREGLTRSDHSPSHNLRPTWNKHGFGRVLFSKAGPGAGIVIDRGKGFPKQALFSEDLVDTCRYCFRGRLKRSWCFFCFLGLRVTVSMNSCWMLFFFVFFVVSFVLHLIFSHLRRFAPTSHIFFRTSIEHIFTRVPFHMTSSSRDAPQLMPPPDELWLHFQSWRSQVQVHGISWAVTSWLCLWVTT